MNNTTNKKEVCETYNFGGAHFGLKSYKYSCLKYTQVLPLSPLPESFTVSHRMGGIAIL